MAFGAILKTSAAMLALMLLVGCEEEGRLPRNSRHYVPIPGNMISLMAEKSTTKQMPILLRAYKQESELEVWKQNTSGEYVHIKTYPMCRWSGQLGPKMREGDRQVPEGFYSITAGQLNPNSSYYLSFNVGYPNAYDKAHGRGGALIMVHGACSSAGCFSMTDEQIAEIYAITREAFAGGQKSIQLQSLPFRFSPTNLAKYRADPHMPFWKMLKEGADSFEVTKREPKVAVCASRYVFNKTAKDGGRFESTSACPPTESDAAVIEAVAAKSRADDIKVAELVEAGTRAVRRIYKDGDQHPVFRTTQYADVSVDGRTVSQSVSRVSRVDEMSRPDAVDHGPVDIPVETLKDKSKKSAAQIAASLPVEKQKTETAVASPASSVATTTTASVPVKAAATTPAASVAARTPSPVPGAQAAGAQVPAANAQAFAPAAEKPQGVPAPFYQGWLSLGAKDNKPDLVPATELEKPVPVQIPVPPKAPYRQAQSPAADKLVDAGKASRTSGDGLLSRFSALIQN